MIRNKRSIGDRLAVPLESRQSTRVLRALGAVIALQLAVATSVLAKQVDDAAPVAKPVVDDSLTPATPTHIDIPTTTTTIALVQEVSYAEVSPVQDRIEQKLVESGVQVVNADAVNDQNQLTASVDGFCGLQYRLIPTIGGLLVQGEAVGPLGALVDPLLISQNGMEISDVFHPEGQYEIGFEFPIDINAPTEELEASIEPIASFLATTTQYFCGLK